MGGLRVYMVNFDTAIPLFTFTFSFRGGGGREEGSLLSFS